MSPRRDHVTPAVKASPEAVAQAVSLVREALDIADYHSDTVASAHLTLATSLPEQAYAWMMAAILIADVADVDSMTLRSLQTSIHKGTQGVFSY